MAAGSTGLCANSLSYHSCAPFSPLYSSSSCILFAGRKDRRIWAQNHNYQKNKQQKQKQKKQFQHFQLLMECNARKAKQTLSSDGGGSSWDRGFSVGVDLGDSCTGVAVSIGFAPRPLPVLHLRGRQLELRLMEIAEQEEADEFIIGLPLSVEGMETSQSNKVRSIAGRFAVRAAERGWRVYLQNEHGTSEDALELMIKRGLKRTARRAKLDSYSAMILLQRYFSTEGSETEIVLPKDTTLQKKIFEHVKDDDFDP